MNRGELFDARFAFPILDDRSIKIADARVGPLSGGKGGPACDGNVRAGFVWKSFLPTVRSEIIEYEHADFRREIVAISTAGDRCY